MELRESARTFVGGVLATAMRDLNARHPGSHNNHFHCWILVNLPDRRHLALDVGCGRGELLACLSPHFDAVWGADVDSAMRQYAASRCAGLPNVTVTEDSWTDLSEAFDLVTMIAVLHHLDVTTALTRVAPVCWHRAAISWPSGSHHREASQIMHGIWRRW
jgi:2-polyprenyl-3-methyl-5-hydroxy-6-metoxy-1,4-benzoquinol methylase